jgi:tRNA (guanine9-N1)-methyltransferase
MAANSEGQETRSAAKPKHPQFIQLPITLVLDCGFDDLMNDQERKSLGSQITRSYSDNHRAPYQTHLTVSSFGGHLKKRFDGLLEGQYHAWKGVRFLEEDFVKAAEQANEWMNSHQGGKLAGVFADEKTSSQSFEELANAGEVVYLSSDSPYTLTELRPYSTYIIGGLVDRNRHKGVCYKRALDRGMKTAKLPIGDYMQMTSRFVLATNHVVEIMLRWLELGDWGEAFLRVVPKRKGGVLKDADRGANGESNRGYLEDDHELGDNTTEKTGNAVSDQREENEDEKFGAL